MASQSTKKATEKEPPHRQIRALYDEETITVYQAYSAEIAEPAVNAQRLNASPKFLGTRMTWIKTSWCWMMFVPYPFPFLSLCINRVYAHMTYSGKLNRAHVGTDPATHTKIPAKSAF